MGNRGVLLYVDLGKLEDEPYRLSKIYDTLGQYIDDIRRQRDIIYISKMAESLDISSLDRYRAQLVDEYDRLGTLKKILDEAYDLYKECNEKFEASGQTLCNLYAETPWYETSEGKLAIGIGVLVVTAAVAIVCPAVLGATAAAVTQSVATSALVGSAISGIMNGAASVKAGKSFFDGFASGVEEGAIIGALCGMFGAGTAVMMTGAEMTVGNVFAARVINAVGDATIGTATYIYHENKYDKAITGGDVAKTWAECAITSFVLRSVFEGGKSSSKADGKNRVMSTSKGRVESESSITCETSYGKSRKIIQCNTKDAAADELAKRIGGQSRSAFADDPIQREFDVISDQYIAQAKPPLKCVNKTVRTQMKATFEAAKKYERKIYYQFEGIPSQEVLDKLYEYSERYGVEVIIDTEPLGILN
mgnify:CR=1 FL=1